MIFSKVKMPLQPTFFYTFFVHTTMCKTTVNNLIIFLFWGLCVVNCGYQVLMIVNGVVNLVRINIKEELIGLVVKCPLP